MSRFHLSTRPWVFLAMASLSLSCGRSEHFGPITTCEPVQNGTPRLPQQQTEGKAVQWALDGERDTCIPVTFHSIFRHQRAIIDDALKQWSGQSCSRLCFATPIERDDAPSTDTDLRLHFAFDGSTRNVWVLTFELHTGRARNATVWLRSESTIGDVLKQVGHALRFRAPTAGALPDTVYNVTTTPSTATALGADDKQAVCAAYPECT